MALTKCAQFVAAQSLNNCGVMQSFGSLQLLVLPLRYSPILMREHGRAKSLLDVTLPRLSQMHIFQQSLTLYGLIQQNPVSSA